MIPRIERARFDRKTVAAAAEDVAARLVRDRTPGKGAGTWRAVPVLIPAHRDTIGRRPLRLVLNQHAIYGASRWRWVGTYLPGKPAHEIEADVWAWLHEFDRHDQAGVDPACWMDPHDERL